MFMLFVCLWFFAPLEKFITHMKTSSLPVKKIACAQRLCHFSRGALYHATRALTWDSIFVVISKWHPYLAPSTTTWIIVYLTKVPWATSLTWKTVPTKKQSDYLSPFVIYCEKNLNSFYPRILSAKTDWYWLVLWRLSKVQKRPRVIIRSFNT